jgi:hypothetical protein
MKTCMRCGADADIEATVTIVAKPLTARAERELVSGDALRSTQHQLYCLGCCKFVGEVVSAPIGGELTARGRPIQ